MNPRRLYRCRHDRQLAGVAAGMAEYLEADPTLVRVLWILSAFLGGFTIVLYIILAFVIPLEPAPTPAPGPWQTAGPAWGAPPTAGRRHGRRRTRPPAASRIPAPDRRPAAGRRTSRWHAPRCHDQRPDARRGGRGGLYLGVLLIVFGAIALVNAVIPGWAGSAALGPAFLVAVGVALLVGATRRGAYDR